MGLEAATYISGLVATNPVGATDPVSQGDDHIRLLKNVLQSSFPAIAGAVTATHTELSQLHGGVLTSLGFGAVGAPTYSFSGDTDTGIYRSTANEWSAVAGGSAVFAVKTSSLVMNSGKLFYAANGSAAAPSISFDSDIDSGFYSIGANLIGVTLNGALVTTFGTSGLFMNGTTLGAGDGVVGAPGLTFTSDLDTGFYRIASGAIGYTTNGVETLRIGNFLNLVDGAAATPAYTFTSDTDTGMYRSATNSVAISCGGVVPLVFTNVAGSGTTQIIDGTTAVPSLAFFSDPDTGFRRPSANCLSIVAGAADIAKFDSDNSLISFTKQLALTINSANSATTGAANALPANPVGYMAVTLNGTQRRIPYYGD